MHLFHTAHSAQHDPILRLALWFSTEHDRTIAWAGQDIAAIEKAITTQGEPWVWQALAEQIDKVDDEPIISLLRKALRDTPARKGHAA
jgi:hypothetical protein